MKSKLNTEPLLTKNEKIQDDILLAIEKFEAKPPRHTMNKVTAIQQSL
jgi:hypothetical protein